MFKMTKKNKFLKSALVGCMLLVAANSFAYGAASEKPWFTSHKRPAHSSGTQPTAKPSNSPKPTNTPKPTSSSSTIENPYKSYNYWYKGATHFHTTKSDGEDSVSEMLNAYKSRNYNFAFLTDHDVITTESISGILRINASEVATTKGDFNAFGIKTAIPAYKDPQIAIDEVNKQGGLIQNNHPTREGSTTKMLDGLKGLWGIEARNEESGVDKDITLWDDQLSQGKRMWATFGDDAHGTDAVGNGWIMVNSPTGTCNEKDIIANMRIGNFYCSEGPTMNITVDGNTIKVTTNSSGTIKWYKEKRTLIKTTNGASDTYTVTGKEIFVRIVVADSKKKEAWSQPLFIKK